MLTNRIRATLVVLAASAGLAGCTSLSPYGGIGVGVGSPYGYGGQYGYNGYGYDPYYAGYGYSSGYGSAYGYDPFGWYNGYYYPGTGYWVYDTHRTRRVMTDAERAYWQERIRRHRGFTAPGMNSSETTATASATTAQQVKENWSGFSRRGATSTATGTARADQRSLRQISEARRQAAVERRQARAQVSAEREQLRAERQEARQSASQDGSESRPTRRRPRD